MRWFKTSDQLMRSYLRDLVRGWISCTVLLILIRIRQSLCHTGIGFKMPWQPKEWWGGENVKSDQLDGRLRRDEGDSHYLDQICMQRVMLLRLSAPLMRRTWVHHGTVWMKGYIKAQERKITVSGWFLKTGCVVLWRTWWWRLERAAGGEGDGPLHTNRLPK